MRAGRANGTAMMRGGSTPFNLLPCANTDSVSSAGAGGHGAGTPLALCDWWMRYICPDMGTVLDPFMGTGTVNVAAEMQGKHGVGIEIVPEYFDIACRRVEAAARQRELDAAQLTFAV